MTKTESDTELSLAQKTISNIKIDTLLPEITLTLSLEDFTDFSKAAKLELKKSPADILASKTAETVRTLSCVQLAAGDYIGANKMIEAFLENQDDDEEENYELLCQFGLTFVLLNDLRKAVHTFRYIFYNIENTSDVALMLAYLYRALLDQEKSKKTKCALYKKTVFWLKNAACLNPASKQVADFFYKTAFKTETEYFARFMEKFVNFPSSKKDKEYFIDSMNILGNCYFGQNRFADCLEVLQEICGQDYFFAGIWSNIALCNIRMNKSDRAIKNAEKSYLKLKETDGKRLKHNVSSIYGFIVQGKKI